MGNRPKKIMSFMVTDFEAMTDYELEKEFARLNKIMETKRLSKLSDIDTLCGILINIRNCMKEFVRRGIVDEQEANQRFDLNQTLRDLNIITNENH